MIQFRISMIALIGENRELGKDNNLLVRIPEDLLYFKNVTMGHPVIMGRKTYESIGAPLDGRINIVLTKKNYLNIPGVKITHSLEEAISLGESIDPREIFIIGGGQIYHQAIKVADKLYLTLVHQKFDADTFFPDYHEFKHILYRHEGVWKEYKFTILELSKY